MTVDESPSPTPAPARFEHLVLDAGPLFTTSLSPGLASHYWTVPEVLAEARDEATRARLACLPFRLVARQPSAEALRLVQAFAKASGDAAVLSVTDVRVAALAATLEMETNGAATRMRRQPRPVRVLQGTEEEAGVPSSAAAREAPEAVDEDGFQTARRSRARPPRAAASDDEGEWITPDSLARARPASAPKAAPPAAAPAAPATRTVACMSGDYALQNVLLQMGLRIHAPDGRRIRMVKHWLLRCHACYATTKEMARQFCPACGGPTLMRTSYAVDAGGQLRLYLRPNFQYNTRGTRYPLPAPKGGRHAHTLLLREDQVEYQRALRSHHHHERRAAREAGALADVDDRLTAQFADLGLRGARRPPTHLQSTAGGPPVIGAGRCNPNAARRTPRHGQGA